MNDWREALTAGGSAVSGGAALLASTLDASAAAEWVERIGFPAAALLACGWAGLRLARWVGTHVVQPVVAKHVAFVGALEATSAQNTIALAAIASSETKSQECLSRMEASAALDRNAAAEDRAEAREDRKTSRLAVEGVREAIDRLGRALDSTPVNGRPAA